MKIILASAAFLILAGAGCTSVQEQKTTESPATSVATITPCDVSELCLQESKHEGGLLGVARVQAHYVGEKTFPNLYKTSDPAPSCPMMQIDSANDPRVLTEVAASQGEGAQPLFAISKEEAEMYKGIGSTSSESPTSLLVYVAERTGKDTGPCAQRVHILNY